MKFSHIDFSLMETENLEILLTITEIDIKLADVEEKHNKANWKRRRRMRSPMDQRLHYEENCIWSIIRETCWLN